MKYNVLKCLTSLMSGTANKRKLFILIYHRVFDAPDFMYPTEVDKERFAWQMALLAKHFNVLSLADAMQALEAGTLPPRAVCITFDDGYADNYLNALPILQQNKLTATFFVASGYLDGGRMWNDTIMEAIRNAQGDSIDLTALGYGVCDIDTLEKRAELAAKIQMAVKYLTPEQREQRCHTLAALSKDLPTKLMMTTQQLQAMQQAGMEIGGHTVSHPILASLSDEAAYQEIVQNKQALEDKLNTQLRFFAYPNGKVGTDYQQQHVELVRQAGYQAAVSTVWGVSNTTTDKWQLARFTPWDNEPFKFMLRMLLMYRQVKTP